MESMPPIFRNVEKKPGMDFSEFFGEPISVYSDAQAIEDGVLVDVSSLNVSFARMPINRMTKHLWAEFEPLFTTNGAMDLGALAKALRTKCEMAVYRGGIWTLPPHLWLIENEVGGWTLMYPEDY
ncbi:MAG TPA: hypothetical protein VLD57_10525 [Blastocatellia bacterium]|nr:hypothetical protein [Blastocatellia bacterium]